MHKARHQQMGVCKAMIRGSRVVWGFMGAVCQQGGHPVGGPLV